MAYVFNIMVVEAMEKSDNGLCSQYQRANTEMRDCNVMWPCNDYSSTIANGKTKMQIIQTRAFRPSPTPNVLF